jgi:hypothetical protein
MGKVGFASTEDSWKLRRKRSATWRTDLTDMVKK